MTNTTKNITKFDGKNRFLSNFYPAKVCILGINYLNTEAAYQASKTTDMETRELFCNLDPSAAKKLGRKIHMNRSDWDITKVECMELCLRAKFIIPELRDKLIATGDVQLIEGNYWNDTFWGVCKDEGQNMLGKLLMIIRDDMRNSI